jgi:hypothetical protein
LDVAPVGAPPPFTIWEALGNRFDITRTLVRRESEAAFLP